MSPKRNQRWILKFLAKGEFERVKKRDETSDELWKNHIGLSVIVPHGKTIYRKTGWAMFLQLYLIYKEGNATGIGPPTEHESVGVKTFYAFLRQLGISLKEYYELEEDDCDDEECD